MTELLYIRLTGGRHTSPAAWVISDTGKNILQRMQEGVSGSVGDAPPHAELMDKYLRQLQQRYSSQHKRVAISEGAAWR